MDPLIAIYSISPSPRYTMYVDGNGNYSKIGDEYKRAEMVLHGKISDINPTDSPHQF